jgi:chromosome segregation ATPase
MTKTELQKEVQRLNSIAKVNLHSYKELEEDYASTETRLNNANKQISQYNFELSLSQSDLDRNKKKVEDLTNLLIKIGKRF